jgi:hypothetical protein
VNKNENILQCADFLFNKLPLTGFKTLSGVAKSGCFAPFIYLTIKKTGALALLSS